MPTEPNVEVHINVEIIQVWSEQIGEPETAVWCDDCLLPSAISATFVVGTGMRVLGRGRVTRCEDCGREQRERI